ncbi:alpha-amylase family glycosyl hydrolase [Aquisalimonas asiatica]|uniref:Alpha-glucosidase n=1 Tax=Aquisalimonas asiatica TaxID=406100 RepID=A0A1H8RJ12_9GAMM|nr:alpha-amylase family glycosyl hydrolase [Aquisalimonas asiatica]SEO66312.1 alpha-glucosidase [Aquisalimonas asiatica]
MRTGRDDWWRGAVIYQIYPRSFADSNGDGIGDLPGITTKLDYVADLGVDAIWLSPFFRSPMKDFGYDISDYRDVDPLFGTLQDFDALVARAHELGLKVMIDQVLSHSSDQHPWFQESRQDRTNPKADWYVWADPNADGTPPNNWLSIFGGSAWQWEPRRRQYYLHNFLASQPDLNFHNPRVQDAVLDDVAFWLKRGVDGFRLDVVNFYFHDAQLRSNPPHPDPASSTTAPPDNPYVFQQHHYDKTQPENLAFLRRFRALLDHYGARASVGEIGADDAVQVMADYTGGGDRLHMAYTFEMLGEASTAAYLQRVMEEFEARIGDGWPCWSTGNHDVPRVATRWSGGQPTDARLRAYMATLLSMRGSACIYQGEELGLEEAELRFEELQDPYGIRFWPRFKGRDGCRTPMPWRAEARHAGFSDVPPWLPVPEQHRACAADTQCGVDDSVLTHYRRFLHWRRAQPALRIGEIRFLEAPDDVLLIRRFTDDQDLLAAINLSDAAVRLPLPPCGRVQALDGHGFVGECDGTMIHLPPWQAWFGEMV